MSTLPTVAPACLWVRQRRYASSWASNQQETSPHTAHQCAMAKIKQGASPLPRIAHRRAQGRAKCIAAPAYRTSPCPKSSKEHRRSCISHIAVPKFKQQQGASPLPRIAHRRAQSRARSIAASAYRTSPCPKSKQQRASPLLHIAHRRALNPSSKEHRRPRIPHIAVPKIQAAESKEVGRSSICTACHRHHPHPTCLWVRLRLGGGGGGDRRQKNPTATRLYKPSVTRF